MNRFAKILGCTILALLFLYGSALGASLTRADEIGELVLECPLNGGRLGDPIAFVIRVHLGDGVGVDIGSLRRLALRPQGLQEELFDYEIENFDTLKLGESKKIVLPGKMFFYAPGEYSLKPLSLTCNLSVKGAEKSEVEPAVHTLVSNSVGVKIASMHPQGDLPKSLLIATDEPGFFPTGLVGWQTRSRLYVYAIVTFMLLGFVLFFVAHRCREKGAVRGLSGAAARLQEVASLLVETLKLAEVENHYNYLIEVDHLLRRFIVLQLKLSGIDAGGSGVLFVSRLSPFLESQSLISLTQIWAEIDLTIASERRADPEFIRLRADLVEWLREFCQVEGERYGF